MQDQSTPITTEIPYGYCHCGCGQKTTVIAKSDAPRGLVRGEPRDFIHGHNIDQRKMRKTLPRPVPTIADDGSHALIPLTSGKRPGLFAKISIEDIDLVIQHRWHPSFPRSTTYARTMVGRKVLAMHRLLLSASGDQVVDHINGDGLDNRRENLRLTNAHGNNANRHRDPHGKTSRYKGVHMERSTGKWVASITVMRKKTRLGSYHTQEEAAMAYDDAARDKFGEFAQLNFDAAAGLGETNDPA